MRGDMKNGERTFMFAGEVDNFRVADNPGGNVHEGILQHVT